MEAATLSVTMYRKRAGTTRIILNGELCGDNAAPLFTAVDRALRRRTRRLRLDLRDVAMNDQDGLFVLVDLHRRTRAERCELSLTRVPPPMRTLIEETLLPELMAID